MDDVVARKLTLVEYIGPGSIGILLEVQVGANEDIVPAVREKVDKAVEGILRGQSGGGGLPTYEEAGGGRVV